jgi:hypothetical protein
MAAAIAVYCACFIKYKLSRGEPRHGARAGNVDGLSQGRVRLLHQLSLIERRTAPGDRLNDGPRDQAAQRHHHRDARK